MMCAPRKCTMCTLKPFQAMVNEYFYAIALENKICKMSPPLNLVTRTEDDAKKQDEASARMYLWQNHV